MPQTSTEVNEYNNHTVMQFTSTERQSRPSAVAGKGFMAAIESTYTTSIDPITKQRGGQTWLPPTRPDRWDSWQPLPGIAGPS